MPLSVLDKDQAEGKIKIPSTPTTAFIQYTTEELDQLDQPQHSHRKGQEGEQYPTVPPLVYGITPPRISCWYGLGIWKKRFSIPRSTVMRTGDKQDKFVLETDEVGTPLTQFTQNIMGTSVVTVKPKTKTTQTKTSTQQNAHTA